VSFDDSRTLFSALVLLVALERVVELAISNRNLKRSLARGGVEYGRNHYPWMVAMHTCFLVACLAEVWLLDRGFHTIPGWSMVALVVGAMVLRYWAIATLGESWNTRVVVVPGERAVAGGPYRFVRHPNYLAVVVEVAALPLLHGAWLTAVVFSIANALMLRTRIRVEDEALASLADYEGAMRERGALVPRIG
jgi:methyltransferase